MAPRTGGSQGFAIQAVLSYFARAIGEAIYRADRRDTQADLTELPFPQQTEYEQVGTFVMRLSDRDALRAGLYAGADALVHGGIGSLNQKQRAAAVAMFTRAFMAMKKQMNGQAHADEADLMRALVEADQVASINTQPVNTKPAADLAELETSEVH
jgi:hypothetical protein